MNKQAPSNQKKEKTPKRDTSPKSIIAFNSKGTILSFRSVNTAAEHFHAYNALIANLIETGDSWHGWFFDFDASPDPTPPDQP